MTHVLGAGDTDDQTVLSETRASCHKLSAGRRRHRNPRVKNNADGSQAHITCARITLGKVDMPQTTFTDVADLDSSMPKEAVPSVHKVPASIQQSHPPYRFVSQMHHANDLHERNAQSTKGKRVSVTPSTVRTASPTFDSGAPTTRRRLCFTSDNEDTPLPRKTDATPKKRRPSGRPRAASSSDTRRRARSGRTMSKSTAERSNPVRPQSLPKHPGLKAKDRSISSLVKNNTSAVCAGSRSLNSSAKQTTVASSSSTNRLTAFRSARTAPTLPKERSIHQSVAAQHRSNPSHKPMLQRSASSQLLRTFSCSNRPMATTALTRTPSIGSRRQQRMPQPVAYRRSMTSTCLSRRPNYTSTWNPVWTPTGGKHEEKAQPKPFHRSVSMFCRSNHVITSGSLTAAPSLGPPLGAPNHPFTADGYLQGHTRGGGHRHSDRTARGQVLRRRFTRTVSKRESEFCGDGVHTTASPIAAQHTVVLRKRREDGIHPHPAVRRSASTPIKVGPVPSQGISRTKGICVAEGRAMRSPSDTVLADASGIGQIRAPSCKPRVAFTPKHSCCEGSLTTPACASCGRDAASLNRPLNGVQLSNQQRAAVAPGVAKDSRKEVRPFISQPTVSRHFMPTGPSITTNLRRPTTQPMHTIAGVPLAKTETREPIEGGREKKKIRAVPNQSNILMLSTHVAPASKPTIEPISQEATTASGAATALSTRPQGYPLPCASTSPDKVVAPMLDNVGGKADSVGGSSDHHHRSADVHGQSPHKRSAMAEAQETDVGGYLFCNLDDDVNSIVRRSSSVDRCHEASSSSPSPRPPSPRATDVQSCALPTEEVKEDSVMQQLRQTRWNVIQHAAALARAGEFRRGEKATA